MGLWMWLLRVSTPWRRKRRRVVPDPEPPAPRPIDALPPPPPPSPYTLPPPGPDFVARDVILWTPDRSEDFNAHSKTDWAGVGQVAFTTWDGAWVMFQTDWWPPAFSETGRYWTRDILAAMTPGCCALLLHELVYHHLQGQRVHTEPGMTPILGNSNVRDMVKASQLEIDEAVGILLGRYPAVNVFRGDEFGPMVPP